MKANCNLVLRRSAAITALLIAATAAQYASAAQPRMHETLRLLNKAEAKLQTATPNKGGHRSRALQLIEEARHEVKLGMEYARHHKRR